MRLLLDECVPKRLRRALPGHEVRTVQEAGWAGVKNGALLRAADGLFEVLLTVDQGVQYQQNLSGFQIGVVIMVAPSNDIDDLRPLVLTLVASGGVASGQDARPDPPYLAEFRAFLDTLHEPMRSMSMGVQRHSRRCGLSDPTSRFLEALVAENTVGKA